MVLYLIRSELFLLSFQNLAHGIIEAVQLRIGHPEELIVIVLVQSASLSPNAPQRQCGCLRGAFGPKPLLQISQPAQACLRHLEFAAGGLLIRGDDLVRCHDKASNLQRLAEGCFGMLKGGDGKLADAMIYY
jgi:hypothetical protein